MRISAKWSLALAAVVLSTGCYGSFGLTKKLYDWNGHACGTGKGPSSGVAWGNEAVFLVCNIIPVYGFCALVDAVILNSIEFWTGNNPMGAVTTSKLDDTHDLRLEKLADKMVKVEILENGNVVGTYTTKSTDAGTMLLDASGNAIAVAATNADGTVSMVDAR